MSSSDRWLQVRAARACHADTRGFDLWRIPGRKHLTLDGQDLALTVDVSGRRMHMSLSSDLAHGTVYASTVPLTPALRQQMDSFHAQAQALEGLVPHVEPTRPPTRAALMHLRALQALDASQAGASHREVARALFGPDAVIARWHEDSEVRAQVRHVLRRADAWMNGGYLALAGIAPAASQPPGDEQVR